MAQTAFSIRMDEDLKRDFSDFCNSVGMSMTTAFVIFARKTLSERRIPFIIEAPKESETARLARRGMELMDEFRARNEALGLPDLTMEEIDAEIAAARKERRERKAREAAEKAVAG